MRSGAAESVSGRACIWVLYRWIARLARRPGPPSIAAVLTCSAICVGRESITLLRIRTGTTCRIFTVHSEAYPVVAAWPVSVPRGRFLAP